MEEAEEKITFKSVAKEFFTHFKEYPVKQIISAAYLPAALLYYEILFHIISVQEPFTGRNWRSLIFGSFRRS